MIEIYFLKINKLINNYLETKNDKYRIKLLTLFLDNNFSVQSLKLINFSFQHDFDLFIEFINYYAFLHKYNFKQLRYISEDEIYEINMYKYADFANDDFEAFQYFKNNMMNK